MKHLIPTYLRKLNKGLLINNAIEAFLDFLFPQKCLGCGKSGPIICKACLDLIPFPEDSIHNKLAPNTMPIIAAACYKNETMRKAIWLLKYKKIKTAAKPIAWLICERCIEDLSEIDTFYSLKDFLIIPVPVSKKRLRERGFNQAEIIASNVMLGLQNKMPLKKFSLDGNLLKKIKETSSQVLAKDRVKRLKNLKGSLTIENPEKIKGKNIILIDDVSTTGATIYEASSLLKKSGARIIIPMVAAR